MNAEASSSNAGPPPALVIGDTGLYSYKSIKDSDGTAEAHWPGEDDPSGLPQPASDAEGLQFDDLINAVECGSVLLPFCPMSHFCCIHAYH